MDQPVAEPAGGGKTQGKRSRRGGAHTEGIYPNEEDFRREPETTLIAKVLKAAAEKLKITNTTDWVAKVDGRKVDPDKTFKQERLTGIVEIEYHKHEGGGGA